MRQQDKINELKAEKGKLCYKLFEGIKKQKWTLEEVYDGLKVLCGKEFVLIDDAPYFAVYVLLLGLDSGARGKLLLAILGKFSKIKFKEGP